MHDVVVLGAARTPIGSFRGAFAEVPSPVLGSRVLSGACARAGVEPSSVEQVNMGCVLTGGVGQAPARQVTAANASNLNDGAAALVLSTAEAARALGCEPRFKLVAHASAAHEPEWFTTAPVTAVRELLKRASLTVKDVDLFEINEAFAVVVLACMRELEIPPDKVNVHGGAVALGHPIGASGARIIVTLLNALELRGLNRGCATICIGGGEATAVLVERM